MIGCTCWCPRYSGNEQRLPLESFKYTADFVWKTEHTISRPVTELLSIALT